VNHYRRSGLPLLHLFWILALPCAAWTGTESGGRPAGIRVEELREWLNRLSSDQFEGRALFSEGLGLAAGYLAEQLTASGVTPGGDDGTYFQRVRVLGVRSRNRSTVVVESGGESRTFKNGDAVSFAENVGARRSFSSAEIEFVGYGLDAPSLQHRDYAGKDVAGKVVLWLGSSGPKAAGSGFRRMLSSRSSYAIEQKGAAAAIGPATRTTTLAGGRSDTSGDDEQESPRIRSGPAIEPPDFMTAQRLDREKAPAIGAQDDFFEFLFRDQEIAYSQLKKKAAEGEPLPGFNLKGVRITVNLDAEYRVVRTQYTRNVVGIVEGSDAGLKDTYVAFGSHYDHVGYSEGEVVETTGGLRRAEPRGRVGEGALEDRVWNGADDDGSGCVAMLGIAKSFARGPRPRRSMLFVWHTGEERGLYGSRFFADNPSVPLESIVVHVNMDMIGRNREDRAGEENRVYLIGSDRISTELHNLIVDANAALPNPLELDYELNDPGDTEQLYYRSDHYSYAAVGIPVVFLTTGLHPDYHANTDGAEKINYGKMARIARLAYEIGWRSGNLTHAPVRDNRGPRAGKGSTGKLRN
jgi:hypothetical protein